MVKRLDNRGDSEVAQLIRDMTNDVPSEFIEWAANAVIHWSHRSTIAKILFIYMERPTIFSHSKEIKMPLPSITVACNEYDMSSEVNRAILEALK